MKPTTATARGLDQLDQLDGRASATASALPELANQPDGRVEIHVTDGIDRLLVRGF
jgi:hypothetical protein